MSFGRQRGETDRSEATGRIVAGDITALLQRWGDGDHGAFEALMPLVYDELRKLAAAHLQHERDDHTLQPTGLVHEAYMRLVNRSTGNWKSRGQFYSVASQVIRRVLVDHARARTRKKRGGGSRHQSLSLDPGLDWPIDRSVQLLELEDALTALSSLDETQGRIVELRFFTGLTIEETADVMEMSPATVKRSWSSARAWLLLHLGGQEASARIAG